MEWFEEISSIEEGRKLYRRLAKRYHPDRARDDRERDRNTRAMAEISEQWRALQGRFKAAPVSASAAVVPTQPASRTVASARKRARSQQADPPTVREIIRDGMKNGVQLIGTVAIAAASTAIDEFFRKRNEAE